MGQEQVGASRGLVRELDSIARCGRQVWMMVPRARKLALAAALAVMAVVGFTNARIPLAIGALVDRVQKGVEAGLDRGAIWQVALFYLGMIGLAFLVREVMNVLRRYLVESVCAQVDKDLCVRLVGHLMMVDLGRMSREQVGSLHGRIHRSVEGFVRLLRVTFLDFIPAILFGVFALQAAISQAAEGRPGHALRGADLDRADGLAVDVPEGHPPRPDADPRGDGRHGRRAAHRARLRPRREHPRAGGPPGRGGGRAATGAGGEAPLPDVALRLRQGAQRGDSST